MTVRFYIDLAPNSNWGMNKIYAGTHWDERKQQAQQVHLLVRAAIRKQHRNIRKFTEPVTVCIWYNSRLDIDNHGYLAKLIIDGMKGVLIEDDDRRYVKELYQGFYGGDRKKIIVEVFEYGSR